MASSSGVAAPYVAAPNAWHGNDGNWSTFAISAGTPPQLFSVLPSTMSSETWLPLPGGCEGILLDYPRCPIWRGMHEFEGSLPLGYENNASSTWVFVGPYDLGSELNLLGQGTGGYFGLDTITIRNAQSERNISLASQLIAGVVEGQLWLGSLGLGTAEGEFSVRQNILSLLDTLESQNDVPSSSVGYTAGAFYANDGTPGSLVFGGYDQSRFTPSNLSFPIEINSGGKRKLTVSIESLVAQAEGDIQAMLPGGSAISAVIDSTVATSWFPQEVCDQFQDYFGLEYDNSTGFYLVNDTTHTALLQKNPTIIFALGPANNSSTTTNIEIPYSAFDLEVGIPYYNFSTRYFPIVVSANVSQQTLGRAFMQETYLFADWERMNFTIGQAIHQNNKTDIVAVYSPASSSSSSSTSGSGLSGGAIAGIVVGVVVAVALVGALVFLALRRRRRRRHQANKEYSADEKRVDSTDEPSEISSKPVYEMHDSQVRYELPAHEAPEVEGSKVVLEADSTPVNPKPPAGRGRGEMKVQLLGEIPRDSPPFTPISPLTGNGTNSSTGTTVQLLRELPRG